MARDRRVLVFVAVLLAVAEIVDAFFVSFPAGPAVFAGLLLVGALWTWRSVGMGGPILIAVLCVFEIANAPSWPRHTFGDWISVIAFGATALTGLVVPILVIRATRSTRRAATP